MSPTNHARHFCLGPNQLNQVIYSVSICLHLCSCSCFTWLDQWSTAQPLFILLLQHADNKHIEAVKLHNLPLFSSYNTLINTLKLQNHHLFSSHNKLINTLKLHNGPLCSSHNMLINTLKLHNLPLFLQHANKHIKAISHWTNVQP